MQTNNVYNRTRVHRRVDCFTCVKRTPQSLQATLHKAQAEVLQWHVAERLIAQLNVSSSEPAAWSRSGGLLSIPLCSCLVVQLIFCDVVCDMPL